MPNPKYLDGTRSHKSFSLIKISDETRVEYIKEGILDACSVHGQKQRISVSKTYKCQSDTSSTEPDHVVDTSDKYVSLQHFIYVV